jgi:CyaY protein
MVINTHRAARQIWMAAVASAWKFDYDAGDGRWRTSGSEELRDTIRGVIKQRVGIDVPL